MPRNPEELSIQRVPPVNVAGGVRLDTDAALLEPDQSPNSVNWVHRRGRLSLREGLSEYASISSNITASKLEGPWHGLYQATYEDGVSKLFATNWDTSTTAGIIFEYDGSNWTDRSGSAVTDGGNLQPWDFAFGIDGTLTSSGGAVIGANGENRIYYGTSGVAWSYLANHGSWSGPSGVTNLGARYVMTYNGRLFLGYTIEDSTTRTTRVRASAINNYLEFDTTAGGKAVDLAETPGEITGMKTFGENGLALKKDAIHIIRVIGDTTIAMPKWLDVGCLSGRSFQYINDGFAFFLGVDNIYRMTLGGIQTVGDPVARDLFDRLNQQRLQQIVSHADDLKSLYRLWVPVDEDDYATRCYTYNWLEDLWFAEDYPTEVHSAETVSLGSGTTIGNLSDSIGNYSNPIGDWGAEAGSPALILGTKYSSSSYRIHKATNRDSDDASTSVAIEPTWESADLRLNSTGYSMLRSVTVYYNSDNAVNITCEISTDRGESFPTSTTKAVSDMGSGKSLTFYFRSFGLYHRIKLSTDNPLESSSNPLELLSLEINYQSRGAIR